MARPCDHSCVIGQRCIVYKPQITADSTHTHTLADHPYTRRSHNHTAAVTCQQDPGRGHVTSPNSKSITALCRSIHGVRLRTCRKHLRLTGTCAKDGTQSAPQAVNSQAWLSLVDINTLHAGSEFRAEGGVESYKAAALDKRVGAMFGVGTAVAARQKRLCTGLPLVNMASCYLCGHPACFDVDTFWAFDGSEDMGILVCVR